MAKRVAERELTDRNWDDEEEVEEVRESNLVIGGNRWSEPTVYNLRHILYMSSDTFLVKASLH